MTRLRFNDYEAAYMRELQGNSDRERLVVPAIMFRGEALYYEDRMRLSDLLEYRRYVELQAMRIAPPKHSATNEALAWASSFFTRIHFLDGFVHHLRGVGPAPEPQSRDWRRWL